MTDPRHEDLIARLAAHRTLANAPRVELEWLVAHGTLAHYELGAFVARKGEPVEALYIVLEGRMSHFTDQGGAWRKVMDWRAGDVTGYLPYSRMNNSPGNSIVDEATTLLQIPHDQFPAMVAACPHVTATLVHVMIDRAKTFKSSDLQVEKMASLGKLAAGLAHELNNPASAAAHGARRITQALIDSDNASRALGAAGLDARELALVERMHAQCLAKSDTTVRTPLERADREEAIADWLDEHGVSDALAEPLADTSVTLEMLNELAATITGDKLHASLQWAAAGFTVRSLGRDIERSATRVHELVSAVKVFTYMDRATAPEPVDVAKGLTDTLAVMSGKARQKSASLTIDAPADLPRVRGFGGELNQVWANLVDNALDAIAPGGRVSVTARADGKRVVVRVTDDGPGVPPELHNKIFDPFFTTKPVGKGTGLGLDIVRRLVGQSNGLLDMDSVPGRTEFRVALPVVE